MTKQYSDEAVTKWASTERRGLTAYDIAKSYDWNYAHAPEVPSAVPVPSCPGAWEFCAIPIGSPIGMPAGPLLNSRWVLYYASLGFDVLTYKTVRSSARASYDLPNLVPVSDASMTGAEAAVTSDANRREVESWAISFGMPSKDPIVWQADVEAARTQLRKDKVLVVSVVASPQDDWTLETIAADFARCAAFARDAGADAIEANLSCPNVCTQEGSLYHSADASGAIAAAIRARVRELPLVLKVGLFERREQADAFVRAVSGVATAISTTNTITAVVELPGGTQLFDGARRGIGGRMIGARCLAELRMLGAIIQQQGSGLRLIGVGGVSTAADVADRLAAGAHHVQIATAAMLNPAVGIEIRSALARHGTRTSSSS